MDAEPSCALHACGSSMTLWGMRLVGLRASACTLFVVPIELADSTLSSIAMCDGGRDTPKPSAIDYFFAPCDMRSCGDRIFHTLPCDDNAD
jgi:hypothetical protein